MATIGGPNTEKDNLVFGYDTGYGVADNSTTTRFYPGEPSVNLLPSGPAAGTGDFSRQAAHNESFTYSKVTNYRGRADVHRLYINPTGNTADPYADFGGQYHKSGGSAVGDVYALSLDFYVNKGINKPSLSSIYANGYKSPSSAGAASLSVNNDVDLGDGWTRRTRIATITTAGNTWWRFGCNTNGNETEVYIDNVQIELKSHATPFVNGTRSSTQSLIDLKRTADIDISTVSFDSTGQPTFDGTDDKIVIADQTSIDEYTYETVVKINNSDSSYSGFGSNYKSDASGYSGVGNGWVLRLDPSGNFQVYTKNNSTTLINPINISGFRASNSNKYIHLVYTYEDGSNKIYLNGVLQQTGTGLSGETASDSTLIIGAYSWGIPSQTYYLNGHQPVAKLYSTAFSAEEVKQNYNAYKNRFGI